MKKSKTLPPLRIDDNINFFIDRLLADVEKATGKEVNLSKLRRCFYLCLMKDEVTYKNTLKEMIYLIKYQP